MSKIILLDDGAFTFRSVFQWESTYKRKKKNEKKDNEGKGFIAPSQYNYVNILLSALKKVHVGPDDWVVIAEEGHSWRKDFCAEYKSHRKDLREAHKLIDWDYHFRKIGEVKNTIEASTNIVRMRSSNCEADDIIAWFCNNPEFKERDKIIVASDADLEQLCANENTYFFSIAKKTSKGKGMYKVVKNPYKVISSKVKKGDKSDNIIVRETDTAEDEELRRLIIDLLNLPDFVNESIQSVFDQKEFLPITEYDPEALPFQNSLAKRFPQIFDDKNKITYEYCKQLEEKRHQRKLKKAREKRRKKKEKEMR